MTHTLPCPSCQKVLRLPESALGREVQCPYCKTNFHAPTDADEVGRRQARSNEPDDLRGVPRPPREDERDEEDYDDRPRSRRRSRRDDYEDAYDDEDDDDDRPRRRSREKPGNVAALGAIYLAGGIVAVLMALLWISTCIGILWPGMYFSLTCGIICIIRGSMLLGDDAHRQTVPYTPAILQIINIVALDMINVILGIVALVLLSDSKLQRYFRG